MIIIWHADIPLVQVPDLHLALCGTQKKSGEKNSFCAFCHLFGV